MRKFNSFFLLALLLLMGNTVWADAVTFTFKTDTDITYTATGTSGGGAACEVSKSNVTLAGSNAYTASTKTLSCYANSTLTITAPGNITQIDLSYNGKVYPFDEALGDGTKGAKFAESGAHAATYTPATPATSIVLNNTNGGKTELLTLTVTFAAGEVVGVESVSLDESTHSMMVGEIFTLTATVLPADATTKSVAWSTSDAGVATVAGGVVRAKAAGEATITVTTADGGYTASCVVTVTAKQAPEGAVFFESFDALNGHGGNDGAWSNISAVDNFEMSDLDNDGWTSEGSLLAGFQCVSLRKVDSSTPSGLTTPALGVEGNGHVTFLAESWGTDGSNFFVDIVGDGAFVAGESLGADNISNAGKTAKVLMAKTGTWTTYNLAFVGVTANSKIRLYAPANKRAFLDEVAVFFDAPVYTEATLDFAAQNTDGYWATFSSEDVTFFPNDVVVYKATAAEGALELSALATEEANETEGYFVPANTGVLVYSVADAAIYYTVENKTVAALENNALRAASVAKEATGYKFYMLAYESEALNNLGFYWGAENGAAFTSREGSAYLALEEAAAVAPRFILGAESTTTNLMNTEAAAKVVKAVVDGHIVIIREGKTFDMVGRQVK